MKIKILYSIIICISFVITAVFGLFAQEAGIIDSLQAQLKKHNDAKLELGVNVPALYDTSAAIILHELCKAYLYNDPDKATDYLKQELELSEKIGYKKGIANAYNGLGVITMNKGNYLLALDFHRRAMKIRQEINDQAGIATSYNNLGNISTSMSNYPDALKNYLASLKIQEELGNKQGIAMVYGNIGEVYNNCGNYSEALKNTLCGLKIFEEIGDKHGTLISFISSGLIYFQLEKYSEALKNFYDAKVIAEEIDDNSNMSFIYMDIGNVFTEEKNYDEALKNYLNAVNIADKLKDKRSLAGNYINIGTIYLKQKKYSEADLYLDKGISLARDFGFKDYLKEGYGSLAELDSAQGNFKRGLEHFKLYISLRDSLVNGESERKIIQQQMQYDFDKKESLSRAEQEKKDAINIKEMQRQKLVRNGFVGGSILLFVLSFAIFIGFRRASSEKKKSEELLLNILPFAVASELKKTGQYQPKTFSMVTVMFADFKDYTSVSEKVSAELLVSEINYCFSAFDKFLQKHNIEKIKTVGDAYLCAGGLPTLNYTHAFDIVSAAIEMKDFILLRKKEKENKGEIAFEIRIGIHTGPVVAGIVGLKKYSYDIWGDTVNIAARMEQNCDAGNINISGQTYELVKDKFTCTHRGKIQAKNKGEIDMYYIGSNFNKV